VWRLARGCTSGAARRASSQSRPTRSLTRRTWCGAFPGPARGEMQNSIACPCANLHRPVLRAHARAQTQDSRLLQPTPKHRRRGTRSEERHRSTRSSANRKGHRSASPAKRPRAPPSRGRWTTTTSTSSIGRRATFSPSRCGSASSCGTRRPVRHRSSSRRRAPATSCAPARSPLRACRAPRGGGSRRGGR
jgi:hypothetical protein